MRVKIAKWGNSTGLRLPKAVVQEFGLKPGQEMDLVVEGGEARLRPIPEVPLYRLEDMVAEMKRLGPVHEPPYEDWSAVEAPWPDAPEKKNK
jgi:antitoxin MazE